jgi:erythrocyte band 7 integral membrane protein
MMEQVNMSESLDDARQSVNDSRGRYQIIREAPDEPSFGSCLDCLGSFFGKCCLITCCGCCCYPYVSVDQGTKGVITRFGSIKKIVKSGLHFVNPISEKITKVNVKLHAHQLKAQSLITKDNLPITIDGCVYWRIKDTDEDIEMAQYGVSNVVTAIDDLAKSTLRFVFGQHTLQECLEKRQEFAKEIMFILGTQADGWGILVEDIQILDIALPQHIQNLLATGATAAREAEAQIIMAQANVTSAIKMSEAAEHLNTPAAMQLRMLETYKVLSESKNAKIIFLPSMNSDGGGLDNLTANLIGNRANDAHYKL